MPLLSQAIGGQLGSMLANPDRGYDDPHSIHTAMAVSVFVILLLHDRDGFLLDIWLQAAFSRVRASRECFGRRKTRECHWSHTASLCLVAFAIVTSESVLPSYIVPGPKACLCITLYEIHRGIPTGPHIRSVMRLSPFLSSAPMGSPRSAILSCYAVIFNCSYISLFRKWPSLGHPSATVSCFLRTSYGLFLGSSADLFSNSER